MQRWRILGAVTAALGCSLLSPGQPGIVAQETNVERIEALETQVTDLTERLEALEGQPSSDPASTTRAVGFTPTAVADNQSGPIAVGGRNNPIPIGASARLEDDWTVTVNRVIPNGDERVLAENQFNDPPAPGTQFFLANISAQYDGATSESFDGRFRLRAVGPTSVAYSTFENSCGVIPNELPSAEVFSGGTIQGTVCWEVKAEDANDLVMFDDPFSFEETERVFFSLNPDQN